MLAEQRFLAHSANLAREAPGGNAFSLHMRGNLLARTRRAKLRLEGHSDRLIFAAVSDFPHDPGLLLAFLMDDPLSAHGMTAGWSCVRERQPP